MHIIASLRVNAAKGKTFEEFNKCYKIWDFGYNYYTGKYDEFVSQNMTEEGYKKMKTALKKYLEKIKVETPEFLIKEKLMLDDLVYLEDEENVSRRL